MNRPNHPFRIGDTVRIFERVPRSGTFRFRTVTATGTLTVTVSQEIAGQTTFYTQSVERLQPGDELLDQTRSYNTLLDANLLSRRSA